MKEQDLEELKEDSVYEYIEQFDEEFGSMLKDNIKNAPLLVNIFREYIEQNYKTSKYYKIILHRIVEIEDELYATLTDKQKELFKKWQTYKDCMNDNTIEQSFIYGYCFNKELEIEKSKYNRDDKNE